jgi:hypothetical protein
MSSLIKNESWGIEDDQMEVSGRRKHRKVLVEWVHKRTVQQQGQIVGTPLIGDHTLHLVKQVKAHCRKIVGSSNN